MYYPFQTKHASFEGLAHTAQEMRKFIMAAGIFTIGLKNGAIIHYVPNDAVAFYQWLLSHHVDDIRNMAV